MWAGKRKSTRGGEILSPTSSKKLLMPQVEIGPERVSRSTAGPVESQPSVRSWDHRGMAGSARTTARQAGSGGGQTPLPLSPPDL